MIVDCIFYDNGTIKTAYAKRARGLMARFVCTKKIKSSDDVDKIKSFDLEGYKFQESRSTETTLVFDRKAPPVLKATSS